MVLGRCMKAIRHNQMIKETKKHQIVPYRDSKLTRLFQSFLTGHGKASMVVNISQAPYLFDESMQVLKFAAIANKVTVELIKTPETVKKVIPKRQTRFSILVDASKRSLNPLNGRGSIEWEMPVARSTMMPVPTEETINETMNETTLLDDTMVDQKYDRLMKLVEDLRDKLVKEKQEKHKMEKEIRSELCDEFNDMMVAIEERWEKRLKEEKDRNAELAEWRLKTVQDAYAKSRKRARTEEENQISPNATVSFEREEIKMKLEEKEEELAHLQEKVEAMKEAHNSSNEEKQKLQQELTKTIFEKDKDQGRIKELEVQLQDNQLELESTKTLAKQLAEKNADSNSSLMIQDLEKKLADAKNAIEKLEKDKVDLKDLLNEASDDFLELQKECENASGHKDGLEKEVMRQKMALNDLNSQLEESRLLISDHAERVQEKENVISELEDRVEELSADLNEKIMEKMKLTESNEAQESQKAKLEAENSRLARELNDEIEDLKQAKKKLKLDLEEKEKSSEREITTLQNEVKSLIRAEKQERESRTNAEAEVAMLRKQLKGLNSKQNVEVQALDELKKQMELIRAEKLDLVSKNEDLSHQLEAKEYDLKRTKEEKENSIALYDERLKEMKEKFAVEKREACRIREVMSRSTPVKNKEMEQELNMLRSELSKKTEVIKNLEEMIPSRKT